MLKDKAHDVFLPPYLFAFNTGLLKPAVLGKHRHCPPCLNFGAKSVRFYARVPLLLPKTLVQSEQSCSAGALVPSPQSGICTARLSQSPLLDTYFR